MRRGVLDVEARAVAELNRLPRQRERAGDQRLRRDDRGGGGEADQREAAPSRRQQEERLLGGRRVAQQQRALAEVVQEQRGQHEREPGQPDRPLAEMAHVRVQRFAAGDDEEHGAEHGEAVPAVLAKERDGVSRIDRREHDRCRTSQLMPSAAIMRNQTDHDRAEQPADPVGAVLLNREDADQDDHGDRHDVRRRTAAWRP